MEARQRASAGSATKRIEVETEVLVLGWMFDALEGGGFEKRASRANGGFLLGRLDILHAAYQAPPRRYALVVLCLLGYTFLHLPDK